MPRKISKNRAKKVGVSPGTIIHIGEKKTEEVALTVFGYGEQEVAEKKVSSVEECTALVSQNPVTWINIDGIHQVEIIEQMGKSLQLHPLLLEDIVNTAQRPKLERYDNTLFLVLKMLYHSESDHELQIEQVSIVLGPNFVLSVQEKQGDVFDEVRQRIRTAKGRIRKSGTDYLAYALTDAIVDHYFIIMEKIEDRVELLEEKLLSQPAPENLKTLHQLKREMIFLRKSIWPLREVLRNMHQEDDCPLISVPTRLYLRDVYDHTIQVIESIDTFRDMLSSLLDLYLSTISNRMNAVMKILTLIATIFIPLTFIVGVYGMNFKYMPELQWQWGYPCVWLLMILMATLMLSYFKRQKWF